MKRIIMSVALLVAGSAWGMQENLKLVTKHAANGARIKALIKFQKDRAHGLFATNQYAIKNRQDLDPIKINKEIISYARVFIEESAIAEAVFACVNADAGGMIANTKASDIGVACCMVKYLKVFGSDCDQEIAQLEQFVTRSMVELVRQETSDN